MKRKRVSDDNLFTSINVFPTSKYFKKYMYIQNQYFFSCSLSMHFFSGDLGFVLLNKKIQYNIDLPMSSELLAHQGVYYKFWTLLLSWNTFRSILMQHHAMLRPFIQQTIFEFLTASTGLMHWVQRGTSTVGIINDTSHPTGWICWPSVNCHLRQISMSLD